METLRDDDLVGRQIGRYRIVRQISAGQTTDVYEAEALDLGRQVAFKALKPQEAINPRTLERFNQASAVQVRLSHPNIVPLIDFGRHEGVHFIVNRLMRGSLAERIGDGVALPFTPTQVSALLKDLADALDYAHGLGIIHGDLKPSHILFDEQDRPAWADFGLTSISRSANPGLTVTTAGAPAYMAPEQAMGESATPATDQYALGLIAYQLLTGRLPFEGDTPITILSKHINETPPAPHTLNPQISEALSAVILKVLAKKPEDRYPSMVTFAEAFGEALRSKSEPTLRPLTPAEIEQLERELPDLEMALRFPQNVKDVAKNISLSTQEWRVVGLINPRNSIAQIADTLHLTDLEIRRTVYALLQAGLVELVPARGGERAFPLEVEAPTLEEAILKGLEALDLEDRDQVDYEVLQEPRRGFLGAGARPAIINVWRKPERTVPAPSSTTVTNLINRIKNLGNEAPPPEIEVEAPTAPVEGTPQEEVPAVPVTPPRTSGANKMERFTQRARQVLSLAQEEAQIREHGVIHLEHLMLGLSREVGGVSGRVLLDLGVKEAPLRQMVDNLTVPPLKPTDKGPDLAENVKRSLEFAVDEARRMGHHYIGTEHLLLGLLRAEGADRILSTIQVTAEQIRKTLRQVLRESPPAQVSGEITTETPSTQSNQTKPPTSTKTRMERFTQRARRVLALAQEEAETGEHVVIAPEHLLVALRVEEGGVASRVLMNEGLELAPMRDLLRQTFSSAGQTPPKSPDLNPATRKSLELAVDEARKLGHHYIGTEHLLLGVMRQAEVQNFVERLGFNTDHIRTALLGVLGESPTAPGVANQPTSPAESAESNTGTAAEPRVNASTANDPNVNPNPSLLNQNAAPEPVRKSKRPAAPDQVDQELARQSKQAPTKRPQPADGESATPINVFISYSRKDESFRRTFDSLLNDQLAALGFQAQIGQDTALVAGTTQWGVTVDKTILECDLFVLLISPDSIQSEWCQRELDLARQHDRRILFVLIKPVELSPSLEALRLMWVEMTLEIPLPTMRTELRNALQSLLSPSVEESGWARFRDEAQALREDSDAAPIQGDYVFLYGSSSDGAPHLQRLRRDLERNGVKVWNVSQIQATGTINEQIQRGIRESQAVVVVITPALSAPNAVNAELNLAVQLQKPIIPVQVMVAELPLILRTYQLIDMREPRYEVMLPRLIEAIQRVGAIPSPLSQSPQTSQSTASQTVEPPNQITQPLTPYRNQDVINAFALAAEAAGEKHNYWNWVVGADLAYLATDRQRPYTGPDVDLLPGLSSEQKSLIKRALTGEDLSIPKPEDEGVVGKYTNQDVINAFWEAARAAGERDEFWQWVVRAGLSSIANDRQALFDGPAISTLPNLTPTQRRSILNVIKGMKPVLADPPIDAPPSLLRLNTEVIYEMGAVYPVEIQLASAALEQSVVVRAKNIALIGETAFTIPPQHEGLMRLEARGGYPGGGEISAELYHNGVRVDSSAVAVEVILDPEMVKKPSALPLPEAAGTFARPADLTLRIQLIPLDSVGSVFRLNLSAWSGYDYLQLENTPLGYRDVPRKLIEHLWTRLQRAAANPAIREGEVRAVGRLLWREVLPPELDKLYREQIAPMRKGTRLSGVRTLLIWTESIPGLPPLPFELAIPHRQPLCELFQITRGIEGLGGAWRTEFPLGPVHVTHDPTLSAFTQTPLRWADEGGMSPPETTPSRGLESTHPAVGFHVVRADGALARQSRALTLAGENTDAWEAYLRDQAARLSLKAPLVTLSRLADSTGGSLDDGALALEFLRSGAVSVVSTWWSVSPALDRAFWGAFYRAVWEGETLGAAVHRGREAVRQVAPGSVDGFAFYALGDPLATGYLVVEGIGYLEVMLIDVGQNEERRP